MNTFYILALATSSNNTDIAITALAGYTWLTIAIPVMIALLVIMVFIMVVGIFSVSDHLARTRVMLEDIFAEKLDALEQADRADEESERIARIEARRERARSIKPVSRNHRIFTNGLLISIPILLVVLIIVNLSI